MPSRRECSFDLCDRRTSGRYCSGHAAQLSQNKPLTPLRERGTGPAPCAFDGCDRQSFVRGYCAPHARQLDRDQSLRPIPTESADRCSFEGCTRPRYGNQDLCSAHYQQRKKGKELRPLYEHLIASDAKCEALANCGHPVYASGYCRGHYEQFRRETSFSTLQPPISADQMCTGPKCGRRVDVASELCRSHGLIAMRGEPLTPLILQTGSNQIKELLQRGVYWCSLCQRELPIGDFPEDAARDLPRAKCRLCVGIELRARKHRRSLVDVYRLFEYQNFRCAICPIEHEHESGLHLDHDHACCRAKGESCGKCIRGLLCFGCNGGVLPWYERIRVTGLVVPPLEEYLRQPPALMLGLIHTGTGSQR